MTFRDLTRDVRAKTQRLDNLTEQNEFNISRFPTCVSEVKSNPFFSVKPGVNFPSSLRPQIQTIAKQFFQRTGSKIIISSGFRTPAKQAELMFRWKKRTGRALMSFYRNYAAAKQIDTAYVQGVAQGHSDSKIIASMAKVIGAQVSAGTFVSLHLDRRGIDVSKRGINPAHYGLFVQIAKGIAREVLVESDHWHLAF